MSVYDYSAKTITGEETSLSDYRGKVLLIVNTASKCGFTPQFKALQSLYDTYKDQGFEVLGFPCNQFMNQDPGSDQDIQAFCQKHYGVTFQMFSKINVNGEDAHPLFKFLVSQKSGLLTQAIKWNFTKFLIDRHGEVIARYAPQKKPSELSTAIEKVLQS